jgi:DNA (cytosine-5)-methyltransferase 1
MIRIRQQQGGAYNAWLDFDAPCPAICATQASQFIIEDDGEQPCPSIQGIGIAGTYMENHEIVDDGVTTNPKQATEKQPYRVPLMAEVAVIPWNGLTVASTFAGAGGSSTGYRMAGYRVLWANEFVPAAQESYRANMRPGTVLDCRDIREVQPAEILEACGLRKGELDVFDGSPPCQAFSTAGKRNKGWGQEKRYEHGAKQRNEDLFFEYVRLLHGLMPRAFVAENVSGLVKGVAKGYFIEILAALKASGYRVEARLLDAQWLGVPQTRSRVIFVGVREDLGMAPVFPSPLPYRYSVREAIPWLSGAQFTVGDPTILQRPGNSFPRGEKRSLDLPCPLVCATAESIGSAITHDVTIESANGFNGHAMKPVHGPAPAVQAGRPVNVGVAGEKRKFTIAELRRICSFPDDYVLTGSYAQQWERLGNSVPPLMMRAVAETLRDRVLLPARVNASTKPVPSRKRSRPC